jgi:hypothetical protein
MNGNTSEPTTLRAFLKKIESTYGKARRVWVMDRGIPSEAVLKEMRGPERQTVKLRLPKKDEEVTRQTFSFQVDKVRLKRAQQRDGHYLLRSNIAIK